MKTSDPAVPRENTQSDVTAHDDEQRPTARHDVPQREVVREVVHTTIDVEKFAGTIRRLARDARLLVAHTKGDVRASLEDIRDGLAVLERELGGENAGNVVDLAKRRGAR